MNGESLSIIIPTPDGWPIMRLIDSIESQELGLHDEVIIVGDTHTRQLRCVETLVNALGPKYRYFAHDAGRHAFGHPQRNFGISKATADYLVFIDDDDAFCPDAFENIRSGIRALPEVAPLMFKFMTQNGETLWKERELREGRIGGHQFVVPNVPTRLGIWTDRYEGDFDFIVSTLREWPPGSLVWREELISIARPAQ